MSSHHPFSPSVAHRRIACPGSAAAEAGRPDTSSLAAVEGTVAHAIRETVLRDGTHATAPHAGSEHTVDGHTLEFTRQMAEALQPAVDRAVEHTGDGRAFVEVRLDLGAWVPGLFGTADLVVIRSDRVVINDLKFGQGDLVIARENPQALLYAAGVYDTLLRRECSEDYLARLRSGDIPIELQIDQPRRQHFDRWETTLSHVLRFAERYVAVVHDGQRPDAPRHAGITQCQYCKAAADCPTHIDYLLEALDVSLDDLDDDLAAALPQPETLTSEQKARLFQARRAINKLIDAVGDSLREDYQAGRPTGGMKLIPGSRVRRWADEQAAEQALVSRFTKDEAFVRKLISPAQAEQIAGPRVWKKLETLVATDEQAPRLVPESHKTPGVTRAIDLVDLLDDDDDDFDLELDL